MPTRVSKAGSELFIVDNSDEAWKVSRYLHEWCQISEGLDVATAYFEIGALLALNSEWCKIDKIRILMGDEVSKRTRAAFVEGLRKITTRLNESLEAEKHRNDFLTGVPEIVEAIQSGQIECRVYRKDKFHAKAYITHARLEVVGSAALVGSSNFTEPGLTKNIELNVKVEGPSVTVLQEWYEEHWNEAEDVTPDVLRVIERHVREYTPFEIYVKALQEFFRGHEMTANEWEQSQSRMYRILDQYQREGYHNLLKIARRHSGAFLCDGVGLGKTFIGMMLIERLIMHDRKRVMLIVPKAAREAVWEPALKELLGHVYGDGDFSNLAVFSHTDLQRGEPFPARFLRMKEMADVIVIDEAHHFRNPGARGEIANLLDRSTGKITGEGRERPSRYRQLYDIIDGPNGIKQVFLLTATPINNQLADFRHMMELFTRENDNCLESVGIHSVRGHFIKMERELTSALSANGDAVETNLLEAEKLLTGDPLFHTLVVQRSRAYVRRSQQQNGATAASFPERQPPQIAEYSIKATYGRLLELVDTAFAKERPLFNLALYYPLAYYKGDDKTLDPFVENRQKQIVGLVRVQFLKRFESSACAFERSCERLLIRLLAFVQRHSETDREKSRLEKWKIDNGDLIGYVAAHQQELWGDSENDEQFEDLVTSEMLAEVEYLDRKNYRVEDMLTETLSDLDQLASFLKELKKFQPKHDDKLKALVKMLKSDPVMSKHKVLLFTEFSDTARYLKEQLDAAEIEYVDQVDSTTKRPRRDVIRAFAPYYNGSSSAELLTLFGTKETRVLISTDVLSEGLNLQDATRMVNYDLHWNPVRLMQRIGRVDRRMNPKIEARLIADHPDQKKLRGKIEYWNFLPPGELDTLLRLYGRVAHKTLRISRTFGIEGKKLLRPEDDYEALREFNEAYEGTTTPIEAMHLEYQKLLKTHDDLLAKINALPLRVFSGKQHPHRNSRAVFFCYSLPGPDALAAQPAPDPASNGEARGVPWTEEAGRTGWYLYDLDSNAIVTEPAEIIDFIRSQPDTPLHCTIGRATLSEIRGKIDLHIKNTYLKQVQAPVNVKPLLKCWMELS